jgi:hypothetical protein
MEQPQVAILDKLDQKLDNFDQVIWHTKPKKHSKESKRFF